MKELEKLIWYYIKIIIICKGLNPPEKEPRFSMNRRRGGPQHRSGCQATAPEQTPKKRLDFIDVIAKQQPQNRPQRKGSILYRCHCQVMDPERTPKKTPPLHSNTNTYGQPASFAFIYIDDKIDYDLILVHCSSSELKHRGMGSKTGGGGCH
jgi:hypothetical protein